MTPTAELAPAGPKGDMPDFVPSKLRFIVALLQCLSSGLNGFILQTYVAIWWLTSDTYNVNTTQINMMSMVYAIFYIPGSMLSIYLYSKYGLTHCLIGGALLNFLACWIRCIGAFSYNAPGWLLLYLLNTFMHFSVSSFQLYLSNHLFSFRCLFFYTCMNHVCIYQLPLMSMACTMVNTRWPM